MTRRWIARACCLVFALTWLFPRVARADADGGAGSDIVKLSSPSTVLEIDDRSAAPLLVPLWAEPGWTVVAAQYMAIERARATTSEFGGAFADGGVEIEDGGLRRLQLLPDRRHLARPGVYEVDIQVTARKEKKGDNDKDQTWTGTLRVPLSRVAPTLRLPATITIEITNYAVTKTVTLPLWTIDEVGGRSEVTGLQFATPELKKGNDDVRGGSMIALENCDAGCVLPPNGHGVLHVVDSRDLPLGNSTTGLEVRADQVPLEKVVVSIHSRYWPGFIAFLFLVGGLIGAWVNRHGDELTRKQKLRTDAKNLVVRFRTMVPQLHGEDVGRAEAAISALTAAKEDQLEAALDDAVATFDALAKNRGDELTRLRAKIDVLERARVLLDLPAIVRAALGDDFGGRLDDARNAIGFEQNAAARPMVDEMEQHLAATESPGRRWLDAAKSVLQQSKDPSLPAITPTNIGSQWTRSEQAVATLDAATATWTVDSLVALDGCVGVLALANAAIAAELERLAGVATARLATHRETADEIAAAARIPAPDEVIDGLSLSIDAVRDIAQVVRTRVASAADRNAVQVAIVENRFDEAFSVMEEKLPAALGGNAARAANPLAAMQRAPVRTPATARAPWIPPPSPPPATPRLAVKDHAKELWVVTAARIVLAYVFLPFLAYVTYRDTFVGTAPEVVAIVAAGFFTDFSWRSVQAKLQSLAPSEEHKKS